MIAELVQRQLSANRTESIYTPTADAADGSKAAWVEVDGGKIKRFALGRLVYGSGNMANVEGKARKASSDRSAALAIKRYLEA